SSNEFREVIQKEGAETIAAFIAEPIIGAGGIILPPQNYFKEIREICDEYGIIFIADEVIRGFGRTGKMFGLQNWNVVPDIMTVAKGISSGYVPLGGVVISDKIYKEIKYNTKGTLFHGFTYSGHPVSCAVALKNIEIMERESLVENARLMGEKLTIEFEKIEASLDVLGDGRTMGLLAAIEIYKDASTKERYETKMAPKVVLEAAKCGLICRSVIYDDADTIVLAPPLIINAEQIEKMVAILKQAVETVIINAKV